MVIEYTIPANIIPQEVLTQCGISSSGGLMLKVNVSSPPLIVALGKLQSYVELDSIPFKFDEIKNLGREGKVLIKLGYFPRSDSVHEDRCEEELTLKKVGDMLKRCWKVIK